MKSLMLHAAKDLRIEETSVSDPKAHEVQINLSHGGICGSDLHYYQDGGFGPVRLREPMVLGHEVSGHIAKLGSDVTSLKEGDLVAISPSRPCRGCHYCLKGLPNHCLNMRFYGSAMPMPHIQGAFRQTFNADIAQCAPANGLSPSKAAMAEPLAVCLNAVRRAGSLIGKKVLITGSGPIGIITILAARRAGADMIVATDLTEFTLGMAKTAGADKTINVADDPSGLEPFFENKGSFDVVFECSGAQSALAQAIHAARPQATIVQLGIGGEMTLPMTALTAKELSLTGSFRFHDEFFAGVEMLRKGLIDPTFLITHTLPMHDAQKAFEVAGDRTQAMKTMIDFSDA